MIFPRAARQILHKRYLHLHEYQSKELMSKFGLNTQAFTVVDNAEEALSKAEVLGADELVIKAQVFAGGRGKGTFTSGLKGGVQLTKEGIVENMLNHRLVTHQTDDNGVLVKKVMIAQALDIKKETYFAILMDRTCGGPVMVGCSEGGVEIEKLAEVHPEKILKEKIDISIGVTDEQATKMAHHLGFEQNEIPLAADQIKRLYNLFLKNDAVQVEINPFASTPDSQIVCFDAKITFDDNAKFRQPGIFSQFDVSEQDVREVQAMKHDLNYVGMDGEIGCLVNGAGLAMATMDIIGIYGGKPANFLDVGGSASASQITEALKIITSDTQVKSILVNIFGGIMKCDVIANGIVAALDNIPNWRWPLIVRLSGTNVDQGRKILSEYRKVPIVFTDDLDMAAKKAVESSKITATATA